MESKRLQRAASRSVRSTPYGLWRLGKTLLDKRGTFLLHLGPASIPSDTSSSGGGRPGLSLFLLFLRLTRPAGERTSHSGGSGQPGRPVRAGRRLPRHARSPLAVLTSNHRPHRMRFHVVSTEPRGALHHPLRRPRPPSSPSNHGATTKVSTDRRPRSAQMPSRSSRSVIALRAGWETPRLLVRPSPERHPVRCFVLFCRAPPSPPRRVIPPERSLTGSLQILPPT